MMEFDVYNRRMFTAIVFGAGSDAGNFPMTNHLAAAVYRFMQDTETGRRADSMLRKALSFRSFSYASLLDDAARKFTRRREPAKLGTLISRMDSLIPSLTNQRDLSTAMFIRALMEDSAVTSGKAMESLCVSSRSRLLELADEAGLGKIVPVSSGTTLADFHSRSLKVLLRSYLENPENRVLHVMSKTLVSLESMLLDLFLGFYDGSRADRRRYTYLMWTMWTFFVQREMELCGKNMDCIYRHIPDWPAITLNYTTLADLFMGRQNVIHFHGSVTRAIDCSTRDERDIGSFGNLSSAGLCSGKDAADILECDIIPYIRPKEDRYLIPSMMPPFRIKPVIASDLIRTWNSAMEILDGADRIVVVGYSFNHSDAHFNDCILRWLGRNDKEIFVINPDVKSMTAFFDASSRDGDFSALPWTNVSLTGCSIESLRKGNVVIIPGTSADICGSTGRTLELGNLNII